MKTLLSFVDSQDLFFIGWIFLVPILIQIITLIIGFFIYRRKKFFYRNLNVASILTTSFAIFIMGDVTFSTKKDPQDGLVFVFFPLWIPFIWLICLLVCSAFFYLFKDEDTKEKIINFKEYNGVTFWISVSLVIFYGLFWIYILTSKAI